MSAHRYLALALACLLLAPSARAYEAKLLQSGLSAGVLAVSPPGDAGRLFIVEQTGYIRIFDLDGESLLPDPFLDVDLITTTGGEQGLLGLAFHPDYASNGVFYIVHSQKDEHCSLSNRCSMLARYSVDPADPNRALPESRLEVLEITQPYSNHNGGMIAFGPDGYLYYGLGDGGSGDDPDNRAQNLNDILGKMLRLDVDSALGPYGIPGDNPFVGEDGLDEIWAYGLRNPWRFSFDRATGDLWIGDVGQGEWEEIDYAPAGHTGGENYGWRLMEGTHCNIPPSGCNDGTLVLPVHEYYHSGGACSVTGGYLYRGSVPELQGKYLFADYCSGHVWTYDPDSGAVNRILSAQNLGNITSFGEDAAGEVYILNGNELWRIQPEDQTDVPDLSPSGLRLAPARPNPFRDRVAVALQLDAPRARLDVAVYAVDGRRLKRLHSGPSEGDLLLSWDGRDESGRRLPAGVYLLRAETERERAGTRLTLLR